jgi:transposase
VRGGVIQPLPIWERTTRRRELTDEEWAIISPLLPNKPRGVRIRRRILKPLLSSNPARLGSKRRNVRKL